MRKPILAFTLIFAALVAFARCHAGIIEIIKTGTLDHGDNLGFFQLTEAPAYTLRVQMDTNALDQDPDPTVGLYEAELPVTFDFGPYHFTAPTSVVSVFSGSLRFGDCCPTWGFQFGSDEAFSQYGLDVPEYELYFIGLSFFSQFAPTDELHWLWDGEASKHSQSDNLWVSEYTKLEGTVDGVYTRIQETGGSPGEYSFRVVPEANAGTLCALGCIAALTLRRRFP